MSDQDFIDQGFIIMQPPVDILWGSLSNFSEVLVKASPDLFKSSKIVEGDGKSVGSVVEFELEEGLYQVKFMKIRIVSVDNENKKLEYEYVGDEATNCPLRTFKGSYQVSLKNETITYCSVLWTIAYEKKTDDAVVDHDVYTNITKKIVKDMEAYILNN